MSIRNVKQTEKVKVLFRLLDNQENFETACGKAGLFFYFPLGIIADALLLC